MMSAPARAQVDLSGTWNTVRHEDLPDRGPGVGLGDYTGIPITDGARRWAESWDAARLSQPEQQCRVHVSPYIYRGPLNLRIWEEKDPKTQEVLAIKHYISTYEQTRTIWMDGRPHPPAYAPHTWMGFSTGRWDGDRLIVETTHIKQGWHRRNGVPQSDRTTMTEHYVRHGNYLTHIAVIRDPVYLTEPMVKSQHFVLNTRALPQRNWLWPCQAVVEVATREETDVAHYLPGQNPYLESSRKEANLPADGAAGGAATLYPEWLRGDRTPPAPAAPMAAAPSPVADDRVHVWPVQGNVYMLVGRGGNTTVQVGDDGVLVVDTKVAAMSEGMLAAIRTLSDKPIRYVINTHVHEDHVGGNEPIAGAGLTRTGGVVVGQIGNSAVEGAGILAHENVLKRVSAPTGSTAPLPFGAWPTETYFGDRKDFMLNGEGIEVVHVPNAHTDGDSMVFFRRSDVISTGDLFVTTSYPVIDSERGGSIQGILRGLNTIIRMAIPSNTQEGGTMIVPGHGRVCDEMDVVEYRDMVTIVRDRIQDMINRGLSLDEVRAARPTLDFDARYGADTGPWTTTMFVDEVYRSLSESRK
jgi:glyoxylase-like metal-dependent hydrolase (beta-lactamase superfamily II)